LKNIVTLVILLIGFSCTRNIKFDKTKWQVFIDGQYPNRRAMLKDLTTNYKLKGLSYNQLIDLIGEPVKYMNEDSNKIFYPVLEDYGSDIDPVHTIDLTIKLGADSTVSDYNIEEWKR